MGEEEEWHVEVCDNVVEGGGRQSGVPDKSSSSSSRCDCRDSPCDGFERDRDGKIEEDSTPLADECVERWESDTPDC